MLASHIEINSSQNGNQYPQQPFRISTYIRTPVSGALVSRVMIFRYTQIFTRTSGTRIATIPCDKRVLRLDARIRCSQCNGSGSMVRGWCWIPYNRTWLAVTKMKSTMAVYLNF
ncbi:Os09g0512066 [Oryza sativa Japonica Group]|uniref:Os09g0512066 protein n=1 Tax=Oryza sativa subsp. japonica TaxID=39947 RepID=A0A0P0XP67_ORYSJ|nr:hypothetical protein EE612_048888 [Oryza sativa]BAT08917.1 Os09g0512066 [Oryza sativa Japonica Group]